MIKLLTGISVTSGTQIPVGTSFATIFPDFDFETYSEAGLRLIENKWVTLPNSSKRGLFAVGGVAYSEHPSTEVLSLAYDLKDGNGKRLWIPGMGAPSDLFEHIANGGLLEAWNSSFEYHIWLNVCHKRMGWPHLPLEQLRDAMAKSRAHSLPGGLGDAAKVLQVTDQKIDDGKRLIKKFSMPRNPTKKDDRTRITPGEDMDDAIKLYEYNIGDIAAESDVSMRIPDLSPTELKLWLLDQRINVRGVYLDSTARDNCEEIVRQANEKYTAELIALTGGTVQKPGEVAKIAGWMGGRGIHVNGLTADTVKATLKRDDLPTDVRRVLEIRASLGAASVKKLYAMGHQVSRDGRLKDLFAFCGADRTGRFAGRGPQPQNLPNSGPGVRLCRDCSKHYTPKLTACPWCKCDDVFNSDAEWGIEAVDDALQVIASGKLDYVEWYFGDAIAAVSGCLRGLFSAAPGHELICSDYSAIEAVVLAALAGEQWRLDVFNTHGMIYEMSAAKISGIPFEEFVTHKKTTGDHHPLRKKVGKVAELACFGADTLVLTDSGWKYIIDITTGDLLHDGLDFVHHSGIISRGTRKTVTFDGLTVTPDHKFYLGDNRWLTTEDLKENTHYLKRARYLASLWLNGVELKLREVCTRSYAGVHAEKLASIISQTSSGESPHDVTSARNKRAPRRLLGMMWGALIKYIEEGYLIVSRQLSRDVQIQKTLSTRTTGGAGLASMELGLSIRILGYRISVPLMGGIIKMLRLIDEITTKATSPGTCVLSRMRNNKTINGKLFGSSISVLKCLLQNFTEDTRPTLRMHIQSLIKSKEARRRGTSSKSQEVEVFDVTNCGPRSRFVVLTEEGPLIAHNSGYQGGLGAWKNFGADKHLSDEEIKDAIKAWRAESPAIVKFWYGLEEAAVAAVQIPGACYTYRGITYGVKDDILYCQLLSGRTLAYHSPRLHPDVTPWGKSVLKLTYMGRDSLTNRWVRLDTYGGKLCENTIQATARDILTHAMPALEEAGYPVVLHIHDEVVSEVPTGTGSVEEFEEIMATLPEWAKDWPIKAAGGWRGLRYRKD